MKKSIPPLLAFLFTIIMCVSLNSSSQVFKIYEKDSISINCYNTSGCEISCKNSKGVVKKYTTDNIKYPCTFKLYDFNGDGIEEIFITDNENYEIIDLSKNIPMRISQKEDFLPINLRFTKNENSYTAHLNNDQNFELFPLASGMLSLDEDVKISISDFNNDKIHEICLTQVIKNDTGKILYSINTYKIFKENFFTISDIKVKAM